MHRVSPAIIASRKVAAFASIGIRVIPHGPYAHCGGVSRAVHSDIVQVGSAGGYSASGSTQGLNYDDRDHSSVPS